MRIAAAAIVLSLWRRPWRVVRRLDRDGRVLLLAWGAVLAVMNCCFYVAIDRPLGTVAAIEFLPVIALPPSVRAHRETWSRCSWPCPVSTCSPECASRARRSDLPSRSRTPRCSPSTSCSRTGSPGSGARRDRRSGGLDAGGDRGRHADGRLGRGAGTHRSGCDRRGCRGRDLLVGDPVRERPARDATPGAIDVCAHGLAPARDRDGDRDRRARAGADAPRRSACCWWRRWPFTGSARQNQPRAARWRPGADRSQTEPEAARQRPEIALATVLSSGRVGAGSSPRPDPDRRGDHALVGAGQRGERLRRADGRATALVGAGQGGGAACARADGRGDHALIGRATGLAEIVGVAISSGPPSERTAG